MDSFLINSAVIDNHKFMKANHTNLILANSLGFFQILKNSDLESLFQNQGFKAIKCPEFHPPYAFNVAEVFGIVVAGQKFGAAELSQFPNLKVISPFGVGVDHIDLSAAKARGIIVTNAPGASSRSVAELAVTMALSLARRLTQFDASLKSGIWERLPGHNLFGIKVGIIGLGHIGKEVAKMWLALGAFVQANDLVYDQEFLKKYPVAKASLKDLLKTSDVATLHVPLTDLTKNIINKKTLALMKPGAYLVNTARGQVIDIPALLAILKSHRLGGAGLDVLPVEPPFADPVLKELIGLPNVIATPHIAAVTPDVHYAVGVKVLNNFIAVRDNDLKNASIIDDSF